MMMLAFGLLGSGHIKYNMGGGDLYIGELLDKLSVTFILQ